MLLLYPFLLKHNFFSNDFNLFNPPIIIIFIKFIKCLDYFESFEDLLKLKILNYDLNHLFFIFKI